ncbi:hypothetical protein [Halorubrum tibetense]|uniref:Halobacterial output domain-containing protein n=1 Tax=Halorubrum tibetense TaxID=175631 RepID=A0ABD5SHB4_9EURY
MSVKTETEAALVALEIGNVIESYDKLTEQRFGVMCPSENHLDFIESLPKITEVNDSPPEYDFVVTESERVAIVDSR